MTAAPAAESPLAPLARLAGHSWKGEFAEGGSWDRHCFEWTYDGKDQRIVFHYFNSAGGYSEGDVQPAQNELRFPEERYEQGGKTMLLRTIWRFEGDSRMLAVTGQQSGDKWVEAWRIGFARE